MKVISVVNAFGEPRQGPAPARAFEREIDIAGNTCTGALRPYLAENRPLSGQKGDLSFRTSAVFSLCWRGSDAVECDGHHEDTHNRACPKS